MHNLDANKTHGEEARRQLYKNVASNIEQVLAATLHKAPKIRPSASHHENYPSKTKQYICWNDLLEIEQPWHLNEMFWYLILYKEKRLYLY